MLCEFVRLMFRWNRSMPLLADQGAVPEALREVLTALHPRGQLPLLQVSIGDMEHPTDDWQVEANFAARRRGFIQWRTGYKHLPPVIHRSPQAVVLSYSTAKC